MNKMPFQITNFFLAMQAGPPGLDLLKTMFAQDAEYTEPFSGQAAPHKGRDAIIAAFANSRSSNFDDAVINLGAVEVAGETITVRWTCISQAIPGGQGSGTNVFRLNAGEITSLVTTVDMDDAQ
jgi:hypothetical protein